MKNKLRAPEYDFLDSERPRSLITQIPVFRASPYRLNMFHTCPFKYKCEYIDKLKDKYGKPKPYFTMGANIHRTLKRYLDEVEPAQRTMPKLEELLREEWLKNRKGFADQEEEKKWGNLALETLRLFYTKNDTSITPMLTEDYQKTVIDGDIECIGVVDRVDRNDDGSVSIIDYKTTKYPTPHLKPEEKLQVRMYAMIMQESLKSQIKEVTIHYLINSSKVTTPIEENHATETKQYIQSEVAKIKKETKFPAQINTNCRNCDYLPICPKKNEIAQKTNS